MDKPRPFDGDVSAGESGAHKHKRLRLWVPD
jgi:hypothetical protein